ncbi:uncharacterized protein LOC106463658 [Limulus polyphemus]|uniref:Uncharacterized protein LOC106463658 n=1 Tax=Limulus polyphemus TaxID=6850 RepID=A0ABM1BCD7_LIMPO|nr:uncharacterized protein LOC106463658 [Limulus polyphemus]
MFDTSGVIDLLLIWISFAALTLPSTCNEVRKLSSRGDPAFEAFLRKALDVFREKMKDGLGPIPPLDPLLLSNLKINVDDDIVKMDLTFHKVNIKGLSNFEIKDVKSNLVSFNTKISFTIPKVLVTGTYSLDGHIINMFPLSGKGKYQIEGDNITFTFSGRLVFSLDDIKLSSLLLDHLEWRNVRVVELADFLGGGVFAEKIAELLPTVGKGMFERFQPKLAELTNTLLLNVLNHELRKPEVREIIKDFIPTV